MPHHPGHCTALLSPLPARPRPSPPSRLPPPPPPPLLHQPPPLPAGRRAGTAPLLSRALSLAPCCTAAGCSQAPSCAPVETRGGRAGPHGRQPDGSSWLGRLCLLACGEKGHARHRQHGAVGSTALLLQCAWGRSLLLGRAGACGPARGPLPRPHTSHAHTHMQPHDTIQHRTAATAMQLPCTPGHPLPFGNLTFHVPTNPHANPSTHRPLKPTLLLVPTPLRLPPTAAPTFPFPFPTPFFTCTARLRRFWPGSSDSMRTFWSYVPTAR